MLRWLGKSSLWLFSGPEKTYKVARVKRDVKNLEYWHVLTECGTHLIFPDVALGISSDGTFGDRFDLRRGDEITIRVRGKGVWTPFGTLEKDPFNLKTKPRS